MAQSLSCVLLHIIFSTKNRSPLIDAIIEPELYAFIISVIATHGSYVMKIGGVEDHIHLFVTLPRTTAISSLIEEIKKQSSKWIKTKDSKYQYFSWQKGYGVFSVSASQQQAVERYIDNQKTHHKKHSFQDEYRNFLQLYNIKFDEKYVWD